MNHKPIIAVCGATATGKSRLAVLLAQRLSGEIVSSDSMQIYRGMDIGTAKPTEEEMAAVPHHMIDTVEPNTPYSVADYAADARAAIADIRSRGRTPIVCGGTGLYLDALVYDNKYSADTDTALTDSVRGRLTAFAEKHGASALHDRLRDVDPTSAESIHPNNVRRVLRALTIYETTGKTKTEWDAVSRGGMNSDFTVIGLRFFDRERHRAVIEKRCRKMIESGLVEETERLYKSGALEPGTTAAQAIGYKEILPYLFGEESLSASEERLFYATCRYAKRQATWFYAKDYIRWLDVDGLVLGTETEDELLARALRLCAEDANVTEG